MKTFSDWLRGELTRRDWEPAYLAEKMGVSLQAVDEVLNEEEDPDPDFCRSLAGALDLPPEEVFRKADFDPEVEEALSLYARLPKLVRRFVFWQIRLLAERGSLQRQSMKQHVNPSPAQADFPAWLQSEMKCRGWRVTELARRMSVTPVAV